MKILSRLFKRTLPSLNFAIKRRNDKLFDKLLKLPIDVNQRDKYGYSPLRQSLIEGTVNFSLSLLEHGAEANEIYEDTFSKQDICLLQDCVNCNDLTHAKLLIYFGANTQRIHSKNQSTQAALNLARAIYITDIFPYQDYKDSGSYQHLADAWHKIAQQETDSLLKICYETKADGYLQQALGVDTALSEVNLERIQP